MKLTQTFHVGRFRCHLVESGTLRLDGGGMFGVVPKTLWQRRIPADEKNRIQLSMRCLLVEHDDGPILVDTGIGHKESEKFKSIYGVENAGQTGPTVLDDALAEVGVAADDIRLVVNTHLHFDHAGGNTLLTDDDSQPRPAFRNATYVVQRGERNAALEPNERTAANYLLRNYAPIPEHRWRLLDGAADIAPGMRAEPTPGHTPHHQSIVVEDGGEVAWFLGDLVPTAAHLPLPWIMGFDVEPLVTLESKRRVLSAACEGQWLLLFQHDPAHPMGYATHDGKAYGLQARPD